MSDSISHHTDRHHRQGKYPQTTACDRPEFRLRKSKLPAPIIQDSAANGEADPGRNQRCEAGEQQSPWWSPAIGRAVHVQTAATSFASLPVPSMWTCLYPPLDLKYRINAKYSTAITAGTAAVTFNAILPP